MKKIELTLACEQYDRTDALREGRIQPEGIDLVYLPLSPQETFWRMLRHLDFDVPLIAGGRSSGARVACRTAAELGAAAVLCLAFPLHPPGRPEKSRLDDPRVILHLRLVDTSL